MPGLSPGGAIPRDLREWDRWAASQQVVNISDATPFTPVVVGDFAVNPTSFEYRIITYRDGTRDAEVRVIDNGTSSGTGFFFTIPEEIWPAISQDIGVVAYDNGSPCQASAEVSAAGQITMGISNVVGTIVRFSSIGWTNAGNKGLGNNPIRYRL